uniref:Uncharacterized protein n=1 Tax=Helianthus annuus TaxID=4232 RepID=A0A251SGX9_HELAN
MNLVPLVNQRKRIRLLLRRFPKDEHTTRKLSLSLVDIRSPEEPSSPGTRRTRRSSRKRRRSYIGLTVRQEDNRSRSFSLIISQSYSCVTYKKSQRNHC